MTPRRCEQVIAVLICVLLSACGSQPRTSPPAIAPTPDQARKPDSYCYVTAEAFSRAQSTALSLSASDDERRTAAIDMKVWLLNEGCKHLVALLNQREFLDQALSEDDFSLAAMFADFVNDQQYLVELVTADAFVVSEMLGDDIRASALARLEDEALRQTLGTEFLLRKTEFSGSCAILQQMNDASLANIALHAQSETVAKNAIAYIGATAHLADLAVNAPSQNLRLIAISMTDDELTLQTIVRQHAHRWERLSAIAATEDVGFLNTLIESGGESGQIASLRLATLHLHPTPQVRLGFNRESAGYRRLNEYANRAYLEGESIQVSILHPDEGEVIGSGYRSCEPLRRRQRSSATFKSNFPTKFQPGYVMAKMDDADLRRVFREYLKKTVSMETLKDYAASADNLLLRAAARDASGWVD